MAEDQEGRFKNHAAYEAHFDTLHASYDKQLEASDAWGIEVLKSLFLLNSAGLAGVFALAAGTATCVDRKNLPFLPFAIGVVLAVLSMTIGRYMHDAAASIWEKSLEHVNQNFSPVSSMPGRRLVVILFWVSHMLAYGSGFACLWAGWLLYQQF